MSYWSKVGINKNYNFYGVSDILYVSVAYLWRVQCLQFLLGARLKLVRSCRYEINIYDVVSLFEKMTELTNFW